MPVALIISVLLSAGYFALIAAYATGWKRQKDFSIPPAFTPQTTISVIIPARNEERCIEACIRSVLAQQYPAGLLEVIVVDDHSTDNTAAIIKQFAAQNVRYISLAEKLAAGGSIVAYKKAALAAGIAEAEGELIVTTDADCRAPEQWLRHIAACYRQTHAQMIVAPVIFSTDRSIVQVFQLIDFMSMQGITAAANAMNLGHMSNGANLVFTKTAYDKVLGYQGIDHLASGDDYLLMVKISKLPGASITYLKSREAIIATEPQPTWGRFLQQRIRWASKSGKYNDRKLTAILMLVYLYNLWFAVLGVMGCFHHHTYWLWLLTLLLLKALIEYLYMLPLTTFFNRKWTRLYFPFLQPMHILYIISAGFMGFIGTYTWKGRKVK